MTHPTAGAIPARAPGSITEPLTRDLTPEQAQAVRYGAGPLLVVAGPGAGKTRTLTHRIAYLLASGRAQAWEILAVTFSVRAAGELRLRLTELLGQSRARGVSVATFHSICARMLREHAEAFGRSDAYTVYEPADVRRVIEWLLGDAQRGAIQAALADCGQPASAEVLAEISLAKNRLLTPHAYQQQSRHPAAALVAAVWREADRELRRCNAFDYDDLLVHAVRLLAEHPHRLAFYRQRWPWLLVDEYQDTNQAQSALVALLAGAGGNVTVVGDDDQCVVEGTPVTMADGRRKPIEQVKPGDLVRTATGAGARGAARVLAVRQRRAAIGIAIRTADGRTVISTPDHIHFAGYRLGLTPQQHLVYVMHRYGYGFRVGMTSVYTHAVVKPVIGLQHRCLQERADAAWVVSTHRSEQAARIAELRLSLRYGIPTLAFVARTRTRNDAGGIVANQNVTDELFASIETEAAGRRLLSDEGLSEAHPHHIAQSSEGRGRSLTITLCGAKHGHRLDLTGSDVKRAAKLRAAGYRLTHPKRTSPRHWRLTMSRSDLGELMAQAERIVELTGARIRSLGSVGGTAPGLAGVSLPLMPASAVRPGMVMTTEDGRYDAVESVRAIALERPVYDLDVERTHNFIADGLVTHNCIYSWRGADARQMLRFGERFPTHTQIVLGRNFRCRTEILAPAVACVAHNARRTPKTLIAMRGAGGRAYVAAFAGEREEAHWVAGTIADALGAGVAPGEILVLARTGHATRPLLAELAAAGIAHRVLGSLGLYERTEVRDALAYLTLLANPADAQAFRRAVQSPRRGIGPSSANRVVALARSAHGGDLITASAHARALGQIRAPARDRLAHLGAELERIRGELTAGRSLAHITVATVTLDGGLVRHFEDRRDHSPRPDERRDAERVLEDLRSLCRAAQAYEDQQPAATLTGFLEHAAGLHAQEIAPDQPDRRITVSSIHRAKGTEAQVVIVIGCEEQLLPSWRALASPDDEQLAEERRLFYVACTRAKDRLVLTHAGTRNGRLTGGPSRFLHEAGLIETPQALAA